MIVQKQTHNITLYRGDSVVEELQVLGKSRTEGDPDSITEDLAYDLTSTTLTAQIRAAIDGTIIEELNVEVTDADRGEITVSSTFPIAQIDLGPDKVGVWDLQIATNEATPKVYTAFIGDVSYELDVTHT